MDRNLPIYGLVVALLLSSAAPAFVRAQDTQSSSQDQAAPAQKHARPDLNLTDDQKAQMKKLHEDAKSQIAAVNADSSLTADQKQAKIQQIHRDTHKQTEALLTPDQRKIQHEWRRSHRNEGAQQTPPAS